MSDMDETYVLIVEGFRPVARIYRHFLDRLGFRNVDVASNGAEAIDRLKQREFAVIISDWHMEPTTGFELLQHVRANTGNAGVTFILATIESRAHYIEAAWQAGVSAYMLKPFDIATLRAALAHACPKLGGTMDPPLFALRPRRRSDGSDDIDPGAACSGGIAGKALPHGMERFQ